MPRMKVGNFILATSTLIGFLTCGTSCAPSNVASNLTQSLSTTKESGATVENEPHKPGQFSDPNKPIPANAKLLAQSIPGPVQPERQLSSGNLHVPTGFKFPSMVGSNLLVRTTAYCHKEADSLEYGRKNAAGGILQYGTTIRSAAADWSRFPLGTRFKIHGHPQEYVIDDYGSALTGTNTIDIYKPTFEKMNDWGVRHLPIQIIEWGCFHRSREILKGRTHVPHADHVRQMLRDIDQRYTNSAARPPYSA